MKPGLNQTGTWSRAVALGSLTALALASLISHAANDVSTPGSFAHEFDELVESAVEKAVRQSPPEQGGELAWGESYLLSALVEMLMVRPEDKYAELAVRLSDWMMKARDDRHGRVDEVRGKVITAWSSTNYSGGKRFAWAVHTGMIAAPMARFAEVIQSNPSLKTRWLMEAERLLECAQEAVATHDEEYREGPGKDEGYIYCPYLKKHLPLNMQNALARAWLAIDDSRASPKYRARVLHLARFLKSRMRCTDDGAYVWAYWPPLEGSSEQPEDISHASINVDFMVQCFEHGIVFARSDLDRIEKTLLGHVIVSNDQISNTVRGGGKFNEYSTAVLHWGRLGRHSPAVHKRLVDLMQSSAFEPKEKSMVLGMAYLTLPKVGRWRTIRSE